MSPLPKTPQIEAYQGHHYNGLEPAARPLTNGNNSEVTNGSSREMTNRMTVSPGEEPAAKAPAEDIAGLLSDQAFLLEEVENLKQENSALTSQLAEAKWKQLAAEEQSQLLTSSNEELRHEIKQRDYKSAALHRELEALRGSLDATAGKTAECSVQDLVKIELEKLQEVYEQELVDLRSTNEEILSQSEARSRLLSKQLEDLSAQLKRQAQEHGE